MDSIAMRPIGVVHGGQTTPEDDDWALPRAEEISIPTCSRPMRPLGLAAIAGTPVLDVKPYMAGVAPRGEVHEPRWATELMAEYWSVP